MLKILFTTKKCSKNLHSTKKCSIFVVSKITMNNETEKRINGSDP